MNWQSELSQAIRSDDSFISTDFTPLIPLNVFKQINHSEALRKQFFPSELENQTEGLIDPIGDTKAAKGNGIIHRYGNRVLLTPTSRCPIHCRYCFRRNELNSPQNFLKFNLKNVVSYLKFNKKVEEVILTGGDPLVLSNDKLKNIFHEISKVDSIRYFRIHTRTPIVLPSRIEKELVTILKEYSVKLVLHANHSDEFNSDVEQAIGQLSNHHIQMLSQSVLLAGVNDNVESLEKLYRKFSELGIRPYYLHHPDKVKGAMHFHISTKEGLRIYNKLRQRVSGWMLPQYIIDSPEATGKQQV